MTNEGSTGQAIIPTPVSMGRTAAACVSALVLPGLGHVLLGKWGRGVILGAVIIAMFALGFAMDGHLYKPESGEWLTWFFSFLNSGMGVPYLVCLVADWGIQVQPEQAARVTFEYGNTFLCVAGALNMLAAIDAYDIGVGRKA
ncbi:MAG: hypothetical protein J2P31_01005 [Blastocatellia bacterium]|nr:hypothetical protein [Blastocatellia bacterium]